MKISCVFDRQTRSICMQAEDELEAKILEALEAQCSKGSNLTIRKVVHEDKGVPESFLVEMRINGKSDT